MAKKHRYSAYVTQDFKEELDRLAEEFEMTKGQFLLMILKLGYSAFMRIYQPEKIISSWDLARLVGREYSESEEIKERAGRK